MRREVFVRRVSLSVIGAVILLFLANLLHISSTAFSTQESSYKLPYPAGAMYKVSQGNFGKTSHYGLAKYAFDFDSGFNEKPVLASRLGKVLYIKNDSQERGWGETYGDKANYVIIDHGDGTSALYIHLQYKSVTVEEDQWVEQGQVIGKANSTGWVSGPHLHFQVQRTPVRPQKLTKYNRFWWYTQSIKISFSDKDVLAKEKDGIPKEGRRYKSDNETPSYTGKIAYTAYAVYGVRERDQIWLINEDGTGKELFRESASYPVWSPDGKKIAYIPSQEGYLKKGEIKVANIDGSSDQSVFKVPKELEKYSGLIPGEIHWSPDGKGIFFQLIEDYAEGFDQGEIYFLDLFSGKWRKLGLWSRVHALDVRKSDGKIAFIKVEDKEPRWSEGDVYRSYRYAWIMVADEGGGNQRPIYGPAKIELSLIEGEQDFVYAIPSPLETCAFSPNGKKIAFWLLNWEPDPKDPSLLAMRVKESILALINVDNSKNRNFKILYRTEKFLGHSKLTWSPDGKKIAYEQDDWIWIINVDGSGEPKRLVEGSDPSWGLIPIKSKY